MEKLSQLELVEKVAQATGHSKKTVKEVIDNVAFQVTEHTAAGCAVSINKLGKFHPIDRAPRTVKSTLTGTQVDVPARRALTFKASAGNKDI